ncbi:hypothetical protein [Ruegeria arenilitoris]|uniref:hypothetical protein n=1 Tax=Ruegeria arenilitoris TaxID=1173585 RepID=UPI00147D7A90|nr:hypothetical protein [Ruegeria arenilitoris]
MQKILTHCYLERRRIAFASFMASLAGFVLYSHLVGTVFGLPFPVFAGLLYMVVVGFAAALTTFIFPKLRRLVDGIAFARVSLAISVVATQNYQLVKAPLASAITVVLGAIFLLAIGRRIGRLAQKESAPQLLVAFVAPIGALLHWLDNSDGYAEAVNPETTGA